FHSPTDSEERGERRTKRPRQLVGTHDSALPPGSLAAGIPARLHVCGEELPQLVDVAILQRVEEAGREQLPLPSVGGEPRATLLHMAPRPNRELAAGCL